MGRKDSVWQNRTGGYISTISPTGYDVLINGTDRYLNWGVLSGSTGYGIRDNGGTMEFKDSGGAWAAFGTGGGGTPGGSTTQLQYNNAGAFGGITGATTDGTSVTLTAATFATSMTGSYLTASEILITNSSKQIVSAPVATYPSLTELTYVKGVTSSIQTQINALVSGVQWKTLVACATTANITLSGEQTLDGVLTSTSRVLVKNQTTQTENGIYVSAAGAWARSTDADTGTELVSAAVAVDAGTLNGGKGFIQVTPATITIGASNIVWNQFLSTTYIGTTNRIEITGNVIDISSSYVGQSSITTLGTITTGTWQGTAIANAYITNTITGKTYNGVNLTTGGTSTKYLSEDGTYTTPSGGGGGTPAGSTGEIQFNNAGAFGASSNLFWDNTNNRLGIGTSSPTSFVHQISPAQTALTASTESIDTHFNNARTVQFATGALTLQRSSVFSAPTYSFVGSSTLADAATLAITGAPIEGTNATITRSYALFIQGGNAGAVGTAHGLGIIAPTGGGTNNIFSGFSSGSTEVFQIGASGVTNIKVLAGALSSGTAILKLGTGTLSGSASGNALAVAEVTGFAGNLVAVQLNAANRFQVASTGVVTLSNQTIWQTGIGAITHLLGPTDQNFTIASNTPASGAARTLVLNAANAASAGAGGPITITAGNATNTSGAAGGSVTITAGNTPSGSGSAQGGSVTISAGTTGSTTSTGQNVIITGGSASTSTGGQVRISTSAVGVGVAAPSANITLTTGNTSTPEVTGSIVFTTGTVGGAGAGGAGGQAAGGFSFLPGVGFVGGAGTGGKGGTFTFTGANGGSSVGNAGAGSDFNITLGTGGATTGASTAGGAGGDFGLTGASGGNASGTTSATGGRGSNITILAGTGGNATGASGTRTGGAGGALTFRAGAGGTGATSNGADGTIVFQTAGANTRMTLNNTTLALGTTSITMTGSIAATGSRVTKGWFTDIESTNMPTVGGTAILSSLTAPAFTTSVSVPQIFNADNAIAASGNAATVTRAYRNNVVTNNSAATLTVTMSTTSAAGGDTVLVQILDFSAAAQTITWVNTENSTVTAPTTSNGSTTLPLTIGFKWNTLTSKWRCIASA